MKIILVGTAYPMRGAMAHMNAILGRRLQKHHDVQIVSFTRQYPSFLFPGKTQLDPGPPLFDIPTRAMVDSINPLTWFKAARFIRSQKPDFVIFRYWMPFFAPCFGTIARQVKKNSSTSVVLICDNVLPHEHRPGDKALTKYAFRAADYFVILSGAVEKDLKDLLPRAKYLLSPHPLYDVFGSAMATSEARKRLNITSERVVLFFGYIRRYKGLDLLIEAMPEILKKVSLKLVVAGEFYEEEAKYRARIRELGLESHVDIRSEYIPNDEIPTYFSASDVVVLPYRSATQSGIVQIAYHFNKPVIATDVGGLSEVVLDGKTGFIVPPEDPPTLAGAVIRYFEEHRAEGFSRSIEEEKKQYSWDRFVERLEAFIGAGGQRP